MNKDSNKMEYLGNIDLLKIPKTAFLCSQKCPAEVVLKSYEWAKRQREAGNCIVCSNHSIIEKDVFEILLKGNQPLIYVLPRGLKTKWDAALTRAIENKRLLIVTPFTQDIKWVTRETSEKKNEFIVLITDQIVVGFANPGGQLEKLLKDRTYVSL
ncbi:MAG: DNA-binding protein [Mariniphaga sp.]